MFLSSVWLCEQKRYRREREKVKAKKKIEEEGIRKKSIRMGNVWTSLGKSVEIEKKIIIQIKVKKKIVFFFIRFVCWCYDLYLDERQQIFLWVTASQNFCKLPFMNIP